MPGQRVRHVERLPAAGAQPPRQIDVLLVHEEVLVEDLVRPVGPRLCDVAQGRAPIHRHRPIDSPHRPSYRPARAVVRALAAADHAPAAEHAQAGRVDGRHALPVVAEPQHTRLDGAEPLVLTPGKRPNDSRHEARVELHVLVEEADELAPGAADVQVVRPGIAEVLVGRRHLDARQAGQAVAQ
jgi:hypothetical protein